MLTVGIDIMHYSAYHFLTITDFDPSVFIQEAVSIAELGMIRQLKVFFCEHGLLQELLIGNNTAFCSKELRMLADEWAMNQRFHCAYALAERMV